MQYRKALGMMAREQFQIFNIQDQIYLNFSHTIWWCSPVLQNAIDYRFPLMLDQYTEN